MKKIKLFIALILITSALSSVSQTNLRAGLLSTEGFVEVVNIEMTTKDELYDRAKVWFAKAFYSANDVIQLDDKENGRLIAKANIPYSAPGYRVGTNYSGHFSFTLTIEVREERYRYKIERLSHDAHMQGRSGGFISNERPDWGRFGPRGTWPIIQDQAINDVALVILSLKDAMRTELEVDDW